MQFIIIRHLVYKIVNMKNIILTIVSILLLVCGSTKANPPIENDLQQIKSKVYKAIVFSQGAQVFRKSTVNIPLGISELKFINVSPELEKNSLQCKAPEGVSILSVRHRIDYFNKEEKTVQIKAWEKNKKALEFEVKKLKNLIAVLDEEEKLLKANSSIGGSNTGVSAVELEKVAKIYRERMKALRMEKLELNQDLAALNEEIKDLVKQLNEINASFQEKRFNEVTVKIDAKRNGALEFELNYLIANAGWGADYDIRVKNIQSPILLNYKANVYQKSGEDWNDVMLTLSTGLPYQTGDSPNIEPWLLRFNQRLVGARMNSKPYYIDGVRISGNYNPSVRQVKGRVVDETGEPVLFANVVLPGTNQGTTTDIDGFYSINVPNGAREIEISYVGYRNVKRVISAPYIDIVMDSEGIELSEVTVSSQSIAGISKRRKIRKDKFKSEDDVVEEERVSTVEKAISVEFKIKQAYTIKKDGKAYSVKLEEYSLPADYEYYCAPKLDVSAFLTANVSGWESYNLLSGQANLFYEGTYLGTTYLDATAVEDTLSISLGRDQNIVIEREKNKEFNKKKMLAIKRTDYRGWNINVRNKKKVPIKIIIDDQFPVSTETQIEVNKIAYEKAKLDEESGIITWELEIPGGQKEEVEFKYSVKYPKHKKVFLE